MAVASSIQDPFPNIPFQTFSNFIGHNFGLNISLVTVLTVLFTMTSNLDLLNLHARQQHARAPGEYQQLNSGWIKALARALEYRLGNTAETLLCTTENRSSMTNEQVISSISIKLDSFAKLLKLNPYGKKRKFHGKLNAVSQDDIQPVHVICPTSMECETKTCQSCVLLKKTKDHDVAYATLIKGTTIFTQVPVLVDHCTQCNTIYHADHKCVQAANGTSMHLYLNSATYIKIGQNVWVDQCFSEAILHGMYHFHASASAFAEFWNVSFWTKQSGAKKISCRQVWHAFIQESVRRLASVSGVDLELPDRLPIEEVTKKAFEILGGKGIIQSADEHTCSECTHKYKETSDLTSETQENDTAAEMDQDSDSESERMSIDDPVPASGQNEEYSPVKMVIMDGIVMGHHHCAFEDCTSELANARGGVFCREHDALFGYQC